MNELFWSKHCIAIDGNILSYEQFKSSNPQSYSLWPRACHIRNFIKSTPCTTDAEKVSIKSNLTTSVVSLMCIKPDIHVNIIFII